MDTTTILIRQFIQAINDCRQIYVDKAIECVLYKSDLDQESKNDYLDEVERLFNRLVIKVFVEVSWSDCVWSRGEGMLAMVLAEELMRQPVKEKDIAYVIDRMESINSTESWQTVLEPFVLLEELDEHRPELECALMRMANIVAKIDGNVTEETIGQLKNLKWQLHQFLEHAPVIAPVSEQSYAHYNAFQNTKTAPTSSLTNNSATNGQESIEENLDSITDSIDSIGLEKTKGVGQANVKAKRPSLDDLLAELDNLIGIDDAKEEVRGLVNFLKVQQHRKEAGLPENQISLHMVFEGNPGTGKTTVARLLGKIFGSLGVLERGHLIETDRSGLVAEFVGQTATKTNAIIDEALDGVLFIDEAYSLFSSDGKDAFGAEAMQTLLKRAEDDRDRLIVILAGYSEPMERLLQSNPGLSSRFSRKFNFPDYSPQELCEIFEILAVNNHYVITDDVHQRLLQLAAQAASTKDEHFGNGRLMRNVFENAMRNLADRIVDAPELTPELLTTFDESDIELV